MSYYENDAVQTPLFGERQTRDRVINLSLGVVTAILVTVTLVSAFIFPDWPPSIVNIAFAFVIVLVCGGNLLLIYWYREGDVAPKFRGLIYYNAATVLFLCVCANLYIHEVEKSPKTPSTTC
ncbi:transmembrane protein 243-like [Patiria miniata]|uniref:Transmembrane protein 243 n=1 Tax=Patiria miniata TaxID=46514 RepID=A0A913ZSM6_PATMI|nr:transmembrane protein 243-like [Patiria miniata]